MPLSSPDCTLKSPPEPEVAQVPSSAVKETAAHPGTRRQEERQPETVLEGTNAVFAH